MPAIGRGADGRDVGQAETVSRGDLRRLGEATVGSVQISVHRGQSFRRIADSVPVIADSF